VICCVFQISYIFSRFYFSEDVDIVPSITSSNIHTIVTTFQSVSFILSKLYYITLTSYDFDSTLKFRETFVVPTFAIRNIVMHFFRFFEDAFYFTSKEGGRKEGNPLACYTARIARLAACGLL
jgi:hypothetical protein